MYVLSLGDVTMPRSLTSFAYLHIKLFEVYAYLLSHLNQTQRTCKKNTRFQYINLNFLSCFIMP